MTGTQAIDRVPASTRPVDDPPPSGHRHWYGRLAVHVLAYVVLLAALLALGPMASWTVDDGSYAIQASTLDRTGGWELEHPLGRADRDHAHFGFSGSSFSERGWYTYIKHPAWIVTLSAFHRVGGDAGLFVPTLLGAVFAAAAAWCVAGQGVVRRSIAAFWLVALGPIGAQSTALWAHAPSAALAGWATVAALAIVRCGPSLGRSLGLAAALAAGGLVRSESLIFAAAMVVAVGGYEVVSNRGARRLVTTLGAIGPSCVAVLAAVVGELRWTAAIAPMAESGILASRLQTQKIGWLEGRFQGLGNSVLLAGDQPLAAVLGFVGVGLLCLGATVLLRAGDGAHDPDDVGVDDGDGSGSDGDSADGVGAHGRSADGVDEVSDGRPGPAGAPQSLSSTPSPGLLLAGAGVALLAVQELAFLGEPIVGIAPAWPLAVVALALWRWPAAPAPERVLAVAVGLFTAGVLATQYPEGGALDWGGRFFAPVAVPIAVLGVAAFDRFRVARSVAGRPLNRPALAVIAAVGLLVPAGAAVFMTEDLRAGHATIATNVLATGATAVVSLDPPISRLLWGTVPELRWVTAVDRSDALTVLDDLAGLGERRVAVVGGELDHFEASGWVSTPAGLGLFVLDRIDT